MGYLRNEDIQTQLRPALAACVFTNLTKCFTDLLMRSVIIPQETQLWYDGLWRTVQSMLIKMIWEKYEHVVHIGALTKNWALCAECLLELCHVIRSNDKIYHVSFKAISHNIILILMYVYVWNIDRLLEILRLIITLNKLRHLPGDRWIPPPSPQEGL